MKLLVLAGGFGTRLKTTVGDVPKALAPVDGAPFLQLQIKNWLAQGMGEFVFLLHHQADQLIDFLQMQRGQLFNGSQVNWVIEPMPMDTGGAVAHAVKACDLSGDFLLINADTWLGSGLIEMTRSVAPAIAVVNSTNVSRYGQVHFDDEKRIIAFSEKKAQQTSGWINAGLCRLNADLFRRWDGQPFSLEHKLFPALVRNRLLSAVPLKTDFIDIGVPSDYAEFIRWVETGRQRVVCS
jgi:D-glycero-alpha-D-manno-heptose 1-phosphate guanylyltransferase